MTAPELEPVDVEETRRLREAGTWCDFLGIEIISAKPEEVRGRLAFDPQQCSGDVMQGGAMMGMADMLGAWCTFLNLPEGAGTATIESKTNFFKAIRSGHIHSVTRPLHVGRRTIVVDTEIYNDEGAMVARVTQTQAVLA